MHHDTNKMMLVGDHMCLELPAVSLDIVFPSMEATNHVVCCVCKSFIRELSSLF